MHPPVVPPELIQPSPDPLRTLAESRSVTFSELTPEQLDLLTAAFGKAEIGLCDYTLHVSVARELEADFQLSGGLLLLSEKLFSLPELLRLHLRHAVELALWSKLCPPPLGAVQTLAIALLAAFATRRFYLQMRPGNREKLTPYLPAWLRAELDTTEWDSDTQVLRRLAVNLDSLLGLQAGALQPESPVAEALVMARTYTAVANPTEFTLTLQGDERLLIEPATGLNKYGCSPRPRPEAITFSSCTASSVSDFAYREAELLRHRLMRSLLQGELSSVHYAEMEQIRKGLREILKLEPLETEVILTASGTDAELYPLVLFRSPAKKRLVNVIVAPDEVGSGTVLAAGGRHFSSTTPHGEKVRRGDAVAELDAESIEVVCVPIRRADGTSLTTEELRKSVVRAVSDAEQRADVILLHIVDNTKTGVVVPDVESVLELHAEYPEKLRVVVDACQFRLEIVHLHRYLKHGFCVLITGSKFFTGPPFAGAFLVPPQFSHSGPLPSGFSDYFTRHEIPAVLQSQAANLNEALNFGLLFRWTGAMQEMRAFYTVPSRQRSIILRSFRNELSNSIERNPDLHLLKSAPPARWHTADLSLWDALPTIFSFAVRAPGASQPVRWLGSEELKTIYYLLNNDCGDQLPLSATNAERKLAAQRCHIGQPVTIARTQERGEMGALRIACGARLVYGITYDDTLGATPADRFRRELTDARTALDKISLILRYWDILNRPVS